MSNSGNGCLEQQLAAELSAMTYADLPGELIERTKLFVLDTLGVIAGAAHAPGIERLDAAVCEWDAEGPATVLLTGRRVSPPVAALANGTAAHALDFDDQHDAGRIHTLATVLPAAIAMAQARGKVSGREFLTAVIVGAEFACRIGLCCYKSLDIGCHPTAALGSLAAAVAAAKILNLQADQTLHALALAYVQMGGTTQSNADGALSKRLGAGLAARSGVTAAHLARHGLTGPHRFLEGEAGLFRLYQRGAVNPDTLLNRLGREWNLADLSLKPYPCCRASHSAIQIGLELNDVGVRQDDVGSGEIRLGHTNWLMVGAPFEPPANPVVHAQFNAAYCFGRALLDGGVGLQTFSDEYIRAPASAFARRIRCVDAAEIDGGSVATAIVNLTMRDGSVLHCRQEVVKGSPQDPMTRDEVLQKFRSCCDYGLNAGLDKTDRLAEAVFALDRADDMRRVIAAFLNLRTEGHGSIAHHTRSN